MGSYREMMGVRQAMDRLFEDTFLWGPARSQYEMAGGNLPLDIYQTKDDVVVKAALPGMKPEDVDITLTGDTLTIFENGILTLTLPKAETVRPKQIKIRGKAAIEEGK